MGIPLGFLLVVSLASANDTSTCDLSRCGNVLDYKCACHKFLVFRNFNAKFLCWNVQKQPTNTTKRLEVLDMCLGLAIKLRNHGFTSSVCTFNNGSQPDQSWAMGQGNLYLRMNPQDCEMLISSYPAWKWHQALKEDIVSCLSPLETPFKNMPVASEQLDKNVVYLGTDALTAADLLFQGLSPFFSTVGTSTGTTLSTSSRTPSSKVSSTSTQSTTSHSSLTISTTSFSSKTMTSTKTSVLTSTLTERKSTTTSESTGPVVDDGEKKIMLNEKIIIIFAAFMGATLVLFSIALTFWVRNVRSRQRESRKGQLMRAIKSVTVPNDENNLNGGPSHFEKEILEMPNLAYEVSTSEDDDEDPTQKLLAKRIDDVYI
eukprot:m.140039 g.140039  ORF g.140039 m.140039 type:complete len:373 (-) comp14817_c1_seq1:361-1479(-)